MHSELPQGCTWPGNDPLMQAYHDTEWGSPLFDDNKLFEFIVLDTFQAGLSWRTVLHKRASFRKAFSDFDALKIAQFADEHLEQLMQDTGIIRNRMKIKATITNAQAFLKLQQEHGSFSKFIWQFTGGRPLDRRHLGPESHITSCPESDAMSRALIQAGFKFAGTTICYAFMQAAGMINDHLISCPRHQEVNQEWNLVQHQV